MPRMAVSSVGETTDRLCESAAPHGVFPAHLDDIAPARVMAVELIGPGIAGVESLRAVHARTGASVFLFRDEDGVVQGVLGVVPLRGSGLAALEADRFDAADPDLDDVCLPNEAPAAVYSWGFAAATIRAAGAVVLAKMAMRDQGFPDVPFFCRAATPQGAKVALGKMGYRPFPPSRTGLLIKPARDAATEQAA